MRQLLRRIRGTVGNAVAWGVGWFVSTFAAYGSLYLFGALPPTYSWGLILEAALNFGIIGSVAGTAFSGFIRVKYFDRDLSALSVGRSGMAGAVVAGLFVPAFISLGRFLTGVPWLGLEPLILGGVLAAALGGATAAGSLRLAQGAAPELGSSDRHDLLESRTSGDPQVSGEAV